MTGGRTKRGSGFPIQEVFLGRSEGLRFRAEANRTGTP